MEWWPVLLLLPLWDTILSIPISNDNDRPPRQVDFKECCPCPETEVTADQDVSPTQMLESTPLPSECPCKLMDSTADASMIAPTLQALQPIMRALENKPAPKPILEPEVGLASSVLETLREVTDKEYQDALVRDAERSASKTLESMYSLTQNPNYSPSNVINIIVSPEELNSGTDNYPEESRTQETVCANLSSHDENISENMARQSFNLANAQPSKIFVNYENIIDMDNAASSVSEQAHKIIEKTNLNEPNQELVSANTNVEELLTKNSNFDKELNDALWYPKKSMLTLPNIIDSLKNMNYKPLSEKTLFKSPTDFDSVSSGNIFSPSKENNIFNHLDPISYLKSIKDLKPTAGITKPVRLKDLLKLKDVELIQPKLNNNYNANKMKLKHESSEKNQSMEVSDLLVTQDATNKSKLNLNKFDLQTNIPDIISSASEIKTRDDLSLNSVLVDKDVITSNGITSDDLMKSQIITNNSKKVPDINVETSSIWSPLNNFSNYSPTSLSIPLNSVDTQADQTSESVTKHEENLTTFEPNAMKNTENMEGQKEDLDDTIIRNDSEMLSNEDALANSSTNEIQIISIENNSFIPTQDHTQDSHSLDDSDIVTEKISSAGNTKNTKIKSDEITYESDLNDTRRKITNHKMDHDSFDQKNLEGNMSDKTVTENTFGMSPSTPPPANSMNNINDMNVEASESIYNYYPSVDLNKIQQKVSLSKELIVEPNLMDDNSYRSLVAKHLQQINNLLERNNVIAYNSNCHNSMGNQGLSSQFSQPLSTNMESKDLNLVQKHLHKDSEVMPSNLNEKLLAEPSFNEQKSLKAVLNRNDVNLEDKIQKYFRNKELNRNFFNDNSENLLVSNQDNKFRPLLRDKIENSIPKDAVERSSDKVQSLVKKPLKQFKLEKHRNFFPDSKNVLKDSFLGTDFLNPLTNKLSNQDFKDKFRFPSSTKPLKSTILSDKNKPVLFNDYKETTKKGLAFPKLLETKSEAKNIITDPIKPFNKKSSILKTNDHRVVSPKYFNEDEDLLRAIRDRIPKFNSEKNEDWSHLDRLQNIRDKFKTFETDAKAQLAENIKKMNLLVSSTSRPDLLKSMKKTFDTYFLDDKVKPFDKKISNKVPSLKKSPHFKELKSSASEMIPSQAKTSRNLLADSKMQDISPVFPSLENKEVLSQYLDSDRYPLKDIMRSERITPQLPFKSNDQRGELSRMMKASRLRPPNLNPLIDTDKRQLDTMKDTAPLGSEHINTARAKDEALKENVSYKCKMVCFRDD